jgi:hypothetical protein
MRRQEIKTPIPNGDFLRNFLHEAIEENFNVAFEKWKLICPNREHEIIFSMIDDEADRKFIRELYCSTQIMEVILALSQNNMKQDQIFLSPEQWIILYSELLKWAKKMGIEESDKTKWDYWLTGISSYLKYMDQHIPDEILNYLHKMEQQRFKNQIEHFQKVMIRTFYKTDKDYRNMIYANHKMCYDNLDGMDVDQQQIYKKRVDDWESRSIADADIVLAEAERLIGERFWVRSKKLVEEKWLDDIRSRHKYIGAGPAPSSGDWRLRVLEDIRIVEATYMRITAERCWIPKSRKRTITFRDKTRRAVAQCLEKLQDNVEYIGAGPPPLDV